MKQVLYSLSIFAIIFFYACEPQKDVAPDLGPLPEGTFNIDNSNPNYIKLTVEAQNAFLYTWDLGNGQKAKGASITAYYPFKGDYKVSCTISGKAGAKTVTKNLNISETDPELVNKPGFKELTGSGNGKVWIYDYKGATNDGEPDYLYMTANYDWEEFWWNPYSLDYGHPSPDFYAKMKFDLNGDYNYTFIAEDGTETKGKFILDMDNMTLTIIDANIPDYDEENCDPDVTATGVYQVKILEDNHLYLWQDQSTINPDDFDYGWAWEFKPENK